MLLQPNSLAMSPLSPSLGKSTEEGGTWNDTWRVMMKEGGYCLKREKKENNI